jgi:simple sugar transport system permease protein
MVMGALFASRAAQNVALPSTVLIPLEIALAILGGALWAALVGVLKTRLGVHEIFGGVALNSLANVAAIYLISGPWQPPEGGSAQATAPFPSESLLPPMSSEFPVNLLALLLVFVAIAAVVIALRGTRWGLQLRATGKNARSALLLGVPTTRSAMSAFMVCGGLAGIAGAYRSYSHTPVCARLCLAVLVSWGCWWCCWWRFEHCGHVCSTAFAVILAAARDCGWHFNSTNRLRVLQEYLAPG